MTEENQDVTTEEIEQKTDKPVENKETNENVPTNEPASESTKVKQSAVKKPTKKESTENNPVRGLPKSGRPWKTPKQK